MSSLLLLGIGTDAAIAAGVAFDAVSTQNVPTTGSTTVSWTHTPVGTPSAVIVVIDTWNQDASSVTYGGASLTLLINVSTSTADKISIWGKPSPAAGAQTVQLTYAGTGLAVAAKAVTVTGSDPVTCFRGLGITASGSSAAPSITCTDGLANDLMIGFAGQDPSGAGGAVSLTGGGTDRGQGAAGGIATDVATAPGTASVTFNWTAVNSGAWGAVAAAIKHA